MAFMARRVRFGSSPGDHEQVARYRLAAAAKSARSVKKNAKAGDCERVQAALRYAQANLSYAEANLNSYAASPTLIRHAVRLYAQINRLYETVGWQCTARPGGGHGINRRAK